MQIYDVFWDKCFFNSQSSCPVGWLGQGEDDFVVIQLKLGMKFLAMQRGKCEDSL